MSKASNKIISIYLIIGISWILISDHTFAHFGLTNDFLHFQTMKGIVFVVLTALLFRYMFRKYENRNQKYLNQLKKITEELMYSNDRYDVVTKATNNIIWDYDLKKDLVSWDESLENVLGYKEKMSHGIWWTQQIHPDDKERVNEKFFSFLESGYKEKWQDEYRIVTQSGEIKHIHDRGYLLFNKKGKPIRMIGSMEDISERKKYEENLKELNFQITKRVEELAVSNAELEQFAYVASHDLQEPLRMVTRFLTEIKRKYDSELDEKGREYIHFAVDGAIRMRSLILDLLEYSKAGKLDERKEIIDVEKILEEIIQYNEISIKNINATISWENIPSIKSSKTPLQLVFQNLISNALKYHKPGCDPEIKISCQDVKTAWEFCVSDNGIGIDPIFFDKIFVVFQRLHPKQEYSGTGIGLAICKKIIEKQSGKIWVESEEGKGSSFYFTVTK